MSGRTRLRRVKVLLVAAGVWWGIGGCVLGMCSNEVVARIKSPDGELDAVLFQRDCGATTGFNSQVSVLTKGKQLGDTGGNVFVADSGHDAAPSAEWGGPPVAIQWRGNRELLVRYHRKLRVFSAARVVVVPTGWFRWTLVTVRIEPVDDLPEPSERTQ